MQQSQRIIVRNFGGVSRYLEHSRVLNEKNSGFPRSRREQIQNEFELVDFNGTGRLKKDDIVAYLQQKYQAINLNVLNEVFKKIEWEVGEEVQKEPFCAAYLARQRLLFREISNLSSFDERLATAHQILNETSDLKPAMYATLRIDKAQIYHKGVRQDFVDVKMEYEDHKHERSYSIQQYSYDLSQSSFEVTLPAQENYFFARYKFYDPFNKNQEIGQTYANIALDKNYIHKLQKTRTQILNKNEIVGFCQFTITFESDVKIIENNIRAGLGKRSLNEAQCTRKKQQYEYLQFLWGIRHKPPSKVSKVDAMMIVIFRITFVVLLASLSLVVNSLERYEPLSLVAAMLLAKDWRYVMFRRDKFLLILLTFAGMTLDVIWLILISDEPSRPAQPWAIPLTYVLLATKGGFAAFMIFVEKGLESAEQSKSIQEV